MRIVGWGPAQGKTSRDERVGGDRDDGNRHRIVASNAKYDSGTADGGGDKSSDGRRTTKCCGHDWPSHVRSVMSVACGFFLREPAGS